MLTKSPSPLPDGGETGDKKWQEQGKAPDQEKVAAGYPSDHTAPLEFSASAFPKTARTFG